MGEFIIIIYSHYHIQMDLYASTEWTYMLVQMDSLVRMDLHHCPNGLSRPNGLSCPNGLSRPNGLSHLNGLPRPNQLSCPNGLSFPNGLSCPNGLSHPNGLTHLFKWTFVPYYLSDWTIYIYNLLL